MKKFRFWFVFLSFLLVLGTLSAASRDWEKHPVWFELTGEQRIYAVGDIHGAFSQMADTLEALKVAQRDSQKEFRLKWTGKDSLLIFCGDLCDRGTDSKQVYDAVMDLQTQAETENGKVIVVLGNHEVMMLNGQVEEWAKTLTSHKKQHYQNTLDSFTKDGLDYHQAISETGVYGRWIRNLPLFVIVNGFMFVHGGLPTDAITRSDLAADFKDDFATNNWKKGIFMNHDSVLWNRGWWKDDVLVERNLKALGVSGIVFGHTTKALGPKGKIVSKNDRLIAIDVGMTPAYGYSQGGGLIISTTASNHLVFRAVYPDVPEDLLFSVKMPAAAYPQPTSRKPLRSR